MATIMIGSVQIPLSNMARNHHEKLEKRVVTQNSVVPPKSLMAVEMPSLRSISHKLSLASKEMEAAYNDSIRKMDEALQRNSELQKRLLINKYSHIQQKKHGAVCIRHCTQMQATVRETRAEQRRKEELDFLAGNYEHKSYIGSIIEPIARATGQSVGFRSPYWRRSIKKAVHMKKTPKKVDVCVVMDATLQMASGERRLTIEFIGKRGRKLEARYVKRGMAVIPKVKLPHEEGVYKQKELDYEQWSEQFIMLCTHARYKKISPADISPGDSGLVFDERSNITTNFSKLPHMVVRGRLKGKIINALDVCDEMALVHHY
nr:P1 protein [Yambean mosaic virus]